MCNYACLSLCAKGAYKWFLLDKNNFKHFKIFLGMCLILNQKIHNKSLIITKQFEQGSLKYAGKMYNVIATVPNGHPDCVLAFVSVKI